MYYYKNKGEIEGKNMALKTYNKVYNTTKYPGIRIYLKMIMI